LGTKFEVDNDGNIIESNSISFNARSATSLANNSIFLDTADNKLKFKDNSGVVTQLSAAGGFTFTLTIKNIDGVELTLSEKQTLAENWLRDKGFML